MKQMSEPIIFFGSGPVAAKSLHLLAHNFNIEAVITKPRPPHHRGNVPVLDAAEKLQLPIQTADSRKSLDKLFAAKQFQSRIGVLVDFGIIVSQGVIDYFPLGIVNGHFSLLPEWRGADPITFSILSGQTRTGVSLMLLVAAMDEGPILAQGIYDMPTGIRTPELTEQLIQLSDSLLKETLPAYAQGKIQPVAQDKNPLVKQLDIHISYSRKITKQDGKLDWHKPAHVLEREIRAFIEWPKSRGKLNDIEVIITKAHVVQESGRPGDYSILNNKTLIVYCGEHALRIDRLKPAGKQEMTAAAFLAGYQHLLS